MQKHILAIDLGTSGPKVAIVSTTGQVMASEIEETQLILSHGGGAEQDPADWWSAIARATRRLMESRHVPVESLA
ncbi:MAG TPA: FGGY family carbohydrate kinase, partial [Leptospiraceae bacterium]|nr:FGGY family carbohydrate kinase [Leptospiraceae bacterium]